MPSWLRVNDTKTPTMYSWISRVTCASNATMSTIAEPARMTMPFENASRSPRVCSWRGRKPSLARIDPSTGKPLKAVFAASTRMNPVAAVTRKNIGGTSRNTVSASCPITGSCSYPSGRGSPFGRISWTCGSSTKCTPARWASVRMLRIMTTAIVPSRSSVAAAFFDRGLRNAGTPLLIASTPVSAAQPEEKARSTRKAPARPVSPSSKPGSLARVNCALAAGSSVPARDWNTPTTIISPIEPMKMYTGMANARPDSRTPRRLSSASSVTMATATTTSLPRTPGTIAARYCEPEEIETATVST